jgi:hypothetical protein
MAIDDQPPMYVETMGVFLNRWLPSYDAARAARDESGGFLLPYRHQFFVADAGAIRELGLDPYDPDWARIGWDWVQPRDTAAWGRLKLQRATAIGRSSASDQPREGPESFGAGQPETPITVEGAAVEIHPPHRPIHSVQDFVLQLLTITAGVLIALSL